MDSEEGYFEIILEKLRERYGIDFSLYREGTISRRMARRMAATGSESYRTYASYLENHPDEYKQLQTDLTIKVSRFFRNEPLFEYLCLEIFPELIAKGSGSGRKTLRIWCAGCAFGEEVYSVAICLMEYLRKVEYKVEDHNISIFGTDVDEYALDKAREGEYDAGSLRETRPEIVERYFSCVKAMKTGLVGGFVPDVIRYRVIESLKNLVHFSKHDLTSKTRRSPPSGVVANYDLILCRNLLIYFTRPLQRRAFWNLFNSLNTGGYLVLGKSESIPEELEAFLVPRNSSRKVYKKLSKPS